MELGQSKTEDEISYAYPSSENAGICGMQNGGYCVRIGDDFKGFHRKDHAILYAKSTGLPAARWSIDHPKNVEKFGI